MDRQRSTGRGLAFALLSAASFGTSGSFATALARQGWSPAASVLARISIAAVVLAYPAYRALRPLLPTLHGDDRATGWRSLRLVSVFGVVAVAGCQLCYFQAVQRVSVGVALLLEYFGVVLVVGWMWLRRGERPRGLTAAGSLVALVGLGFIVDLTGDTHVDLIGVLWGMGAAVGLAVYFVLSSRHEEPLPPIAVAGAAMGIGAVAIALLGLAGAVPMHATFGDVTLAGHRTSWLVPTLGLALLAAAFAYVAGITAARLLGPTVASFVGLTEVLFAIVIAWVLLAQVPTVRDVVGGLAILAGVTLVRVDDVARRRRGSDPSAPLAPLAPLAVSHD